MIAFLLITGYATGMLIAAAFGLRDVRNVIRSTGGSGDPVEDGLATLAVIILALSWPITAVLFGLAFVLGRAISALGDRS